jgi:hypothetical protein
MFIKGRRIHIKQKTKKLGAIIILGVIALVSLFSQQVIGILIAKICLEVMILIGILYCLRRLFSPRLIRLNALIFMGDTKRDIFSIWIYFSVVACILGYIGIYIGTTILQDIH